MKLPLHTISQIAEGGVAARRFDLGSDDLHAAFSNGSYSHRDDYYIFGIITCGECTINIDFNDYRFTANEMICLNPGQVHRFIEADHARGIGIIVDCALVDDDVRRIIDRYAIDYRPAVISATRRNTLERILDIIGLRQQSGAGGRSAEIVRHLTLAAVGIVAEVIADNDATSAAPSSRDRIVAAFNDLLRQHMRRNRRPSYYADRLNISPVYLNQIVKAATGMNTSDYIRSRIMLEAKRMLVYSPMPAKEIAAALGFDDYAYFSRAFALCAGMSPAAFRRRYID